MIDPDKCNAVYLLHTEGMAVREISRRLNISRNTVRRIIKQKGVVPRVTTERQNPNRPRAVGTSLRDCEHWTQRVHEKLLEEEGIQIGYSTLTRLLGELGISKPPKTRCDRVPDEPGAEMQHDTTVYRVKLSGQKTKVIASLLYLRYSKRKYLKFYRVFNRFAMKCFLHEALMHWGHAASKALSTTRIWPACEARARTRSSCPRWSRSPDSTASNSSVTTSDMPIEKLAMNEDFGPRRPTSCQGARSKAWRI